jgi:hypothetical protein
MSAGDTALMRRFHVGGLRGQIWDITSNGTTEVVINTGLHTVHSVAYVWTEDIGTTAHVLECAKSGGTVTVTCSGSVSKNATLTILGDP